MTSEAGRDMHPEVAEIADLSEGLLPVDRATQVRLHLADCELCTDVLASLEEIRGLLGTLPAPQRMPDDIAERIDAALAAEALLDSARPDVPRGTSTTTDSGNVPRGTSVSAPSGHAGSSTGPGRSGGSGIRPGGRRSRRLLLVAGSVASALVLGGAVYEVTANQSSDKNESSAMQRPGADASSGATSVAGQVKRLLTGQATSAGPDTGTTMAPNHADTPMFGQSTPPATGHGPAAVPSCVLNATHRTQVPLATEREVFNSSEAYLLVLPHPGNAALVDAFVVNASCTAGSSGTVLFQGTYPR